MGSSPQEQAAEQFAQLARRMLYERTAGQSHGLPGAMTEYNAILPIFTQAKSDVERAVSEGRGLLAQSLGTSLGAIGQSVGESLYAAGAPKGHTFGSAFAGYAAPAISDTQRLNAQLEQFRGAQLSQLGMGQAATLADLIKYSNQNVNTLLSQILGGIGGMKDTTTVGDLLGALQTATKIGSGIYGLVTGNPSILAALLK